MDDIKPRPKPPAQPPSTPVLPDISPQSPKPSGMGLATSKPSRRKRWLMIVLAIVILLVGGGASATWLWYNDALAPRSNSEAHMRVTVDSGETADTIGKKLEGKGVIKSAQAFQWYVQQGGFLHQLKAGTYLFSPTQSVQEIVQWLVEGHVDTVNLTLVPGKNLFEIEDKLVEAGFEREDVQAALNKKYDHPLLKDKPADVNLEGYIFPDTYEINSQTTVEQFIVQTFDTLYKLIQDNDLEAALKARGFNLHQGVTLASLVQLEVSTDEDRRQVAQVFEKRLSDGIPVGSDVTYLYAAQLLGEDASISIDSLYNTRLYKGLPPGAVANFTLDSLQAVANPAQGDYLYFVAGDDGTTHFSRTETEHQENIDRYCTQLCSSE